MSLIDYSEGALWQTILSILWTEVLDIVGKFNWPQYWIKLLTSFIKGIVSQEWALTGTEVVRDYEMRFEAVLSDHPILYIYQTDDQ